METLRAASQAYAHEFEKSRNKVTHAPWSQMPQKPEDIMATIKKGMRALMSSRTRNKGKRR